MHPHYPKRRRCVCHTNPIVAPSGCIPGSQPPVLPSPGFSSPSQLCLLHLLTGKESCPAHLRSFSTFPSCFKPSSSLRSQTMGDVTMTASKFIEHLQYTRCCAKHFIIYNPKNPMWIPIIIHPIFAHKDTLGIETTCRSAFSRGVAEWECDRAFAAPSPRYLHSPFTTLPPPDCSPAPGLSATTQPLPRS